MRGLRPAGPVWMRRRLGAGMTGLARAPGPAVQRMGPQIGRLSSMRPVCVQEVGSCALSLTAGASIRQTEQRNVAAVAAPTHGCGLLWPGQGVTARDSSQALPTEDQQK